MPRKHQTLPVAPLRRSDYSPEYTAQMSGVVALVGGSLDIAATLTQLSFGVFAPIRSQLRNFCRDRRTHSHQI